MTGTAFDGDAAPLRLKQGADGACHRFAAAAAVVVPIASMRRVTRHHTGARQFD